jgi:hypothetical protein
MDFYIRIDEVLSNFIRFYFCLVFIMYCFRDLKDFFSNYGKEKEYGFCVGF